MPLIMQRSLRFLIAGLMLAPLLGVAHLDRAGTSAQAAPPESAAYVPAESLLFLTIDLEVSSTPWLQAAILAQRIDQDLTPQQLFGSLTGSVFGEQAAQIDPELFLGGEATITAIDPDIAGVVDDAMMDGDAGLTVGSVDVSVAAAEVTQGLVLITLPPDVAAAEAAMQQALTQQAEIDGVSVDSTTYEGIEIRSIPANANAQRPGIAIAQVDDAVLAATTADELEAVIDVRVVGAPSMADNELVATVLEPLPADYLAIGVLNGAAASESASGVGGFGSITEVIVPGGEDAFSGFAISAENEGFRIDTRSANAGGESMGAGSEPFEAELIDRMPAETQVFIDGYDFGATRVLDAVVVVLFEVFFGGLEASFVPFDPAASPTAVPALSLDEAANEAYSTLALLLGVNLQTDFVQLLDGEYAVGVWGVEDADIGNAHALMIAQTSDPATVGDTLSTLTNFLGVGPFVSPGASPTTGETDDRFLTVINLSDTGEIAPISIGVVDEELIIGYGEGGEVGLNPSGDSLADTELFGAVTGELPQERNFLLFINLDALQSSLQSSDGGLTMITSGQAFALAGFQDGEMSGTQGLLYIPEP